MTTLTQGQIQAVAVAAGLPNPSLMAAIAMAESSGRTDVVNSINCVGLWQINQPAHVSSHTNWTIAYLKNPLNNALAAKSILNSQGLGAWEAYTNGAYKKYYSGAPVSTDTTQGIDDIIENTISGINSTVAGVPGASQLVDIAKGVSSVADTIANAGIWLSKGSNWLRIGYVAAGGILVIAGLYAVANGEVKGIAEKIIGAKSGKVAPPS